MNTLLDNTDEDRFHHAAPAAEREITLGTTMILLIFFGLAVYGAALFGFGYSLGSKHNGTAPAPVAASAPINAGFGGAKPSPGSPAGANIPVRPADANVAPVPFTPPSTQSRSVAVTPDAPAADASPTEESRPRAISVAATATTPILSAALPSTASGPAIVVQVAAVSHQEDAELIASTLKRRGYAVAIRTEPDKLLHVQVGPFASRKDADAMKARLLADGFNAYVK